MNGTLILPGLLDDVTPAPQVNPVINYFVRSLCRQPYPGHPKGCPNAGNVGCPPSAPLFDQYFDTSQPVYAIVNEFDLAGHVDTMRRLHPDWSERQLVCCLYWQPKARKQLTKELVKVYTPEHLRLGYVVTSRPEAMGVDVTETMKSVGITLEWPPVKIARQVALMAIAKNVPG